MNKKTDTSKNSMHKNNMHFGEPERTGRKHAPVTARLVALRLLRHILDKRQSFDQAQQFYKADISKLEARDIAFARSLVLNALRYKGQLDAVIESFLEKELKRDADMVMHLLRLGAVQLICLKTPPHAAIGELLNLLDFKSEFGPVRRFKALINAVLRRVYNEGEEIFLSQDAAKLNMPEWLFQIWEKDYGTEEASNIATANLNEAMIDIFPRHQGQVLDEETFISLPGGGYRLPSGADLASIDGFAEGKWWVQDIASSLPLQMSSDLIGGFAGKEIYDLCAAPGGKTIQLASAGGNVVAVDISKNRLQRLEENLDRLDLDAEIVVSDVAKWEPEADADFVLLDAPCSATGTMRRHPDLGHIKSQDDIGGLSRSQARLLQNAWRLTKTGGYLLYAVCSLQKSEAEDQVADFLAEANEDSQSKARLVSFASVVPDSLSDSLNEDGTFRAKPNIWEDKGGMDGFYAALIHKISD